MSIRLLNNIANTTTDGFKIPKCPLVSCGCDIRISYPSSFRNTLHKIGGDILTIGSKQECLNGNKDIVQSLADSFIELGWAEIV